MSKLNFEGRYWTKGGLVVAVHSYGMGDNKYKGHVLKKAAPYTDETVIVWNENGVCTGGYDLDINIPVSDYNLQDRVNPQSVEEGIESPGCLECVKYVGRKKGGHSMHSHLCATLQGGPCDCPYGNKNFRFRDVEKVEATIQISDEKLLEFIALYETVAEMAKELIERRKKDGM